MRRLAISMSTVLIALGGFMATAHASVVKAEHRYASKVGHYRRGGREMICLDHLWHAESDWNDNAVNPDSGAYGIPQANPSSWGRPYPLGRYRPQIRWGIRYIRSTYGAPCAGWHHELAYGWY